MAAAEVNPLMTAWDKKVHNKSCPEEPQAELEHPTIKERSNTRLTYFSEPGGARGETPAKTRRDIMATGPTASCLEEPNRTYTINGSVEA